MIWSECITARNERVLFHTPAKLELGGPFRRTRSSTNSTTSGGIESPQKISEFFGKNTENQNNKNDNEKNRTPSGQILSTSVGDIRNFFQKEIDSVKFSCEKVRERIRRNSQLRQQKLHVSPIFNQPSPVFSQPSPSVSSQPSPSLFCQQTPITAGQTSTIVSRRSTTSLFGQLQQNQHQLRSEKNLQIGRKGGV